MTETDPLLAPEMIAAEIADDLEAAMEQFTKITARLAPTGECDSRHGLPCPKGKPQHPVGQFLRELREDDWYHIGD